MGILAQWLGGSNPLMDESENIRVCTTNVKMMDPVYTFIQCWPLMIWSFETDANTRC